MSSERFRWVGVASILAVAGWTACGGGEGSEASAPQEAASQEAEAGAHVGASTSVQTVESSGVMGNVRITRSGQAGYTVKLEVLGVKAGNRYPAELRRGACGEGGEKVADLDPPTVATVGLGSSLTELSAELLSPGESYAVLVRLPDGSRAACGDLRLPAG